MIRRHDATLDEALDLKRTAPFPRARALVWAACALVLLLGYGAYGYAQKQAEKKAGKKAGSPPPASAPGGH